MKEVKTKFIKQPDLNIWELGYWSSDEEVSKISHFQA